MSDLERRHAHAQLLWDEPVFQKLADRIQCSAWVFGRNSTPTPFVTSDNPVAFRTGDNAIWRKAGLYTPGTYVVFPLSPKVVMYCHPDEPPFENLGRFDSCVSPVAITKEMVLSENSGQVFMASRFVLSKRNDFSHERAFARTIGTDKNSKYWRQKIGASR